VVSRALHGAAVVNTISAGFVRGGFGGGRASRLAALLLLKLLSKPLLHAAAALGCHRGWRCGWRVSKGSSGSILKA